MYLSRENGWFTDKDGNEFYVRRNEKFPDNSPAVAAMPQIFDKISDDVPPGAVKAAVAKAKAAAASAATGKSPAVAATPGKSPALPAAVGKSSDG